MFGKGDPDPPPDGFAPIPQLPDRMLASTPTPHLIGPKRTALGRFTGDWQIAESIGSGAIRGRDAWVFDYTSKSTELVGEDTQSTKERCSVVAIDRGIAVPFFRVTRRGAIGRFVGKIASPGLEVGDEAFDREYTVRAADGDIALSVLNPQVRGAIQGAQLHPTWDIGRQWLIAFTKGFEDHTQLVADAERVLAYLPPTVVEPT